MEQYLNLISVPAIAAVVYWTINVIKHAVGENEKFKRCIPLIATALGIVCGIIYFLRFAEYHPRTEYRSGNRHRRCERTDGYGNEPNHQATWQKGR